MELLRRKILLDYQQRHADSRIPLTNWMNLIKLAKWQTPQDIRNAINSVDFLSGNRVIVKGTSEKFIPAACGHW